MVGKDPVELEKYLENKKFALPEEDISTLILSSLHIHSDKILY
jgi:hypothetical protein